jgi:uncharacterized protein YjiS (DUF1127 family)
MSSAHADHENSWFVKGQAGPYIKGIEFHSLPEAAMIRTQIRHAPALPFATAFGAPLGALSNLASLGAVWRRRINTRRALARMDRHLLSDIGLTEADVRTEADKPFWRE